MITILEEFRQYEVIAKRFEKIKGVEDVVLDFSEDGMNLYMTNGIEGEEKKAFEFPLRRLFFTTHVNVNDMPNHYDIMELEDPEPMIMLGVSKAYVFFNDIKLENTEEKTT